MVSQAQSVEGLAVVSSRCRQQGLARAQVRSLLSTFFGYQTHREVLYLMQAVSAASTSSFASGVEEALYLAAHLRGLSDLATLPYHLVTPR